MICHSCMSPMIWGTEGLISWLVPRVTWPDARHAHHSSAALHHAVVAAAGGVLFRFRMQLRVWSACMYDLITGELVAWSLRSAGRYLTAFWMMRSIMQQNIYVADIFCSRQRQDLFFFWENYVWPLKTMVSFSVIPNAKPAATLCLEFRRFRRPAKFAL